jgi:hypothetical protein
VPLALPTVGIYLTAIPGVLAIAVVPNSDAFAPPKFQLDEKSSGMAKQIAPHGWKSRISGFLARLSPMDQLSATRAPLLRMCTTR